jgi:hypothetical protein
LAFVEGDMDEEHLNGKIKVKMEELSTTPETLEKITPAMGVSRDATDCIYSEVGVESMNAHHAKVCLDKDVLIFVDHLLAHGIFSFLTDMEF